MKKLSILTTILFAFGLYMVPATFATGVAADSKDRQPGQGEYQKDQPGQSRAQQTPGTLGQSNQQERQTQSGQSAQQAQRGTQSQQQNLMLVDNLIGTEVQNRQGEQIGEIDSVLVDVESGRIGFVTMKSGGVFGMGEEKYIVPFNALEKKGTEARTGISQQREVVFTLDKQKNQLKEVPEGDIEEAMTKAGQSQGIHEYYGVSPYWEDNQGAQQRQDDTQRQMMQDTKKDPTVDKKNKY